MTSDINDIWAALKARTDPKAGRAKSRLPDVQPSRPIVRDANKGTYAARSTGCTHNTTATMKDRAGDKFLALGLSGPGLQRDVNGLRDADRGVRKRSLERIFNTLQSREQGYAEDQVQDLIQSTLLAGLFECLADPVERCRELALALLSSLVLVWRKSDVVIHGALDALKRRLGVGQPAPFERAEELRVGAMVFVKALIEHTSPAVLSSCKDDCIRILAQGLSDPFHEVRKACCAAVPPLVQRLPHPGAAAAFPVLAEPLAALAHHSHSRVRYAGVEALDALMRRAHAPPDVLSNPIQPALRALTLDRASSVRQATFTALAAWLGHDSAGRPALNTAGGEPTTPNVPQEDHMAVLLPLLLLGITDPDHNVATVALGLVEGVGDTYCAAGRKEMSVDVATVVDAAPSAPQHPSGNALSHTDAEGPDASAASAAANLPPPFHGRASPGARHAVQALLPSLLLPLLRGMHEWTVQQRSVASRAVYAVAALAEGSLLPHLPALLPTLANAIADDDPGVVTRVVAVAHVVGAFCEVVHWLPVALDHGASSCVSGAAPVRLAGALTILAALAHAATAAGRDAPAPLLARGAAWLASEDVRSATAAALPAARQLANAAANVTALAAGIGAGAAIAEPVLHALLHLRGCAGADAAINREVVETQHALAIACGASTIDELSSSHAASLLHKFLSRAHEWTSQDPDLPAFVSLLVTCPGPALAAHAASLCTALAPVLRDQERDAALRMRLLRALDQVLEDDRGRGGLICDVASEALIADVLLPPLIWRAGKSAAAVRFDAITALCTMLARQLAPMETLRVLLTAQPQSPLLTLVIQCMDEDWYADTRRSACFVLERVLDQAGGTLSDEGRRQVYPELTKRLDDSNDSVRVAAAGAARAFADAAVPSNYCDTNTGYFVAPMLVHLDDPAADVQGAVLSAVTALARKKPVVVTKEVNLHYDEFRNRHLLDEVLRAACAAAYCSP